MKRTKFKKAYIKRNGIIVKPHTQGYSYRDFAKFRLKKILASQKQKNVMLAMKQMGKEWASAKNMKPEDIKKNYGQVGYFDNRKKLLDLAEKVQDDYLRNANPTTENKVVDAYALIENLDIAHGYSQQTAEMKKNMARTLDTSVGELKQMASPLIRYRSFGNIFGQHMSLREADRWSRQHNKGLQFATGGRIKGTIRR